MLFFVNFELKKIELLLVYLFNLILHRLQAILKFETFDFYIHQTSTRTLGYLNLAFKFKFSLKLIYRQL